MYFASIAAFGNVFALLKTTIVWTVRHVQLGANSNGSWSPNINNEFINENISNIKFN